MAKKKKSKISCSNRSVLGIILILYGLFWLVNVYVGDLLDAYLGIENLSLGALLTVGAGVYLMVWK